MDSSFNMFTILQSVKFIQGWLGYRSFLWEGDGGKHWNNLVKFSNFEAKKSGHLKIPFFCLVTFLTLRNRLWSMGRQCFWSSCQASSPDTRLALELWRPGASPPLQVNTCIGNEGFAIQSWTPCFVVFQIWCEYLLIYTHLSRYGVPYDGPGDWGEHVQQGSL